MTDIVLIPDPNRTLTVLRNEAESARNGTMVVDGPDIEMAELLDDAADEIEWLRAEYNQVREELDFECHENEALLAENAILRLALHYYASPDEAGAVARNALKHDVAPPTDHNAPGQDDANTSQCPTSKTV